MRRGYKGDQHEKKKERKKNSLELGEKDHCHDHMQEESKFKGSEKLTSNKMMMMIIEEEIEIGNGKVNFCR